MAELTPLRVVVTGSRDRTDAGPVEVALDGLARSIEPRPLIVVQGGAAGVDEIAKKWAESRNVKVETFPANWEAEGKSAGPKRNRRMLDAGAHIVLAFPLGGRSTSPGTWDCIEAASIRGVPVRVFAEAIP